MVGTDKTKSTSTPKYGLLAALACLVALMCWPRTAIYPFLILDFFTPWKIFDSPAFAAYHSFIVSSLKVRPEIPLPEIDVSEADMATVRRLTHTYTFPLVIRNAVSDVPAVRMWKNRGFWANYNSTPVLCGVLEELKPNCVIGDFFSELNSSNGSPFYISGASEMFGLHPELMEHVHSDKVEAFAPTERAFTQIFMGTTSMGSDIHSAIGVNIFRQIAGRKKWWFIPPSQIAYLYPSINTNGFSCHTKTQIGKGDSDPSPWLEKLERYTAVLNPGDALINPPWFWHGIKNLESEDKDDSGLVIGVPTRYGGGWVVLSAIRSDPVLTATALGTLFVKYGFNPFNKGDAKSFQNGIAANRAARKVAGVEPNQS